MTFRTHGRTARSPHRGRAVPRPTTRTLIRAGDGLGTVRRTELPGGLRVVTETVPSVRSVTFGIWAAVGSRDETPALNGATHYLEHLLFKGTGRRSALDISSAIDAVGGEMNAFTTKEYTCYYARVLDTDLPLAVDVICDMLTGSLIEPADVDAERGVVLEEIAMTEDDPSDQIHELFDTVMLGDTPLGRPVLGTVETINALGRPQIARFYKKHYTPANMVIGVAGNVDHATVVRRIKKAFAFTSAEPAAPISRRPSTPFKKATPRTLTVSRPFEQANVILGFNAIGREDDRRYALGVLSTILGGGSSSRLFQEVREHRGLAYSVYSFATSYSDAGMVGVSVGSLPAKSGEVLDVVRAELARVVESGLSRDELDRGRGQMRGGLVLSLEDTASRMTRLGEVELFQERLLSLDEVLEKLAAITLDDVHELAGDLFRRPETLAVVGPA